MHFEKGNKFGKGRELGSKNKKTIGQDVLEQAMADSDLLPIEFMLKTLNDPESDLAAKMWAAEKAAPYCHSKAPQDSNVNVTGTIWDDLLDAVDGKTRPQKDDDGESERPTLM